MTFLFLFALFFLFRFVFVGGGVSVLLSFSVLYFFVIFCPPAADVVYIHDCVYVRQSVRL